MGRALGLQKYMVDPTRRPIIVWVLGPAHKPDGSGWLPAQPIALSSYVQQNQYYKIFSDPSCFNNAFAIELLYLFLLSYDRIMC